MRPDVIAASLAEIVKGLVGPLAGRVAALERGGMDQDALITLVATVQERVAALEARAPDPGPPGPPGPAGLDGKDGAPGLVYCGVYVRGKTYTRGELVTAGGSAFHCERETTAAPGSSSDWILMVKRGRDARDSDRSGHT